MVRCYCALQVNGSSVHKSSFTGGFSRLIKSSTTSELFLKDLRKKKNIVVSKIMKNTGRKLLDAFVDSTFRFIDQPLHPSQRNLTPVEEIEEAIEISSIEGILPIQFPEGVYIRNGSNHLHGGPKSSVSIFGKTNQLWIEGEGMLHALYFKKKANGNWVVYYKNKYVVSETFKLEKQRNKPLFIPNVEGNPLAVLAANLFNKWRFGAVAKHYQNVNVFEHSGRIYTTSDAWVPQEVNICTLESLDYWYINGQWDRPFCSHPKKAPGSGELIIMGVDAVRPYYVVGVVSADGKMLHKVDLKFNRSVLSHEIGVTQNYNVIIDHPLLFGLNGIITRGSLMKYEREGYARIGVMPRYGDSDSVKWFEVEPNCTFHLINCFEEGDEVVVRGCRSKESVIPGPERGKNKFEWFSRGYNFVETTTDYNVGGLAETGFLFHRVYEWRLNMATGEVKEKYLTTTNFSMDFPLINEKVTGRKHKYGYTQVIDSSASSSSGLSKYGGLAKLYFDEQDSSSSVNAGECEQQKIKVEYHKFEDHIFCTGSAFVPMQGGVEEDDGWIITFVHNEDTNVSQAYIIDAKKLESKPIAIITLPCRVPYGHHGIFFNLNIIQSNPLITIK